MAFSLASFFVTCALCYGIFYFVKWHLRRRRLYELASKFDGPRVLPIIGNAHMFIGNSEHLLNQAYKILATYSAPCRVWIGPLLLVGIDDPEQIKAVCLSAKTLGKSRSMEEFTRDLLGEGLFSASPSKWKVHRKLIQPTFHPKILDSFVEIFATQSKLLTDRLERHLDAPEFETIELVSLCALDMICETAMNVKVGAQINENFRFVEAVTEVTASMCERFFNFWLRPDFIFYCTKLGRDQRKNIKYLHDFVDNITQIKKTEFLKRNIPSGDADIADEARSSTTSRQTFLDLLMNTIHDSNWLSDKALRDEVITMVVAGNDTIAHVIPLIMLMLASHPDVQDKVYQELCEIYGNTDIEKRPVTPTDLTGMMYLDRVIKETLRLFPAAPFIVREVTEELSTGEHTLPTGSTVVIGILNLQRNEKYWPDPMKFDPDRFLPEENAKRHPYAHMAFSGGPRNCIGKQYAMLSMKTVIATVLRRFILKKDNIVHPKDIRFKIEALMVPVEPITLRIERRTNN